jgi:hypothetical protein
LRGVGSCGGGGVSGGFGSVVAEGPGGGGLGRVKWRRFGEFGAAGLSAALPAAAPSPLRATPNSAAPRGRRLRAPCPRRHLLSASTLPLPPKHLLPASTFPPKPPTPTFCPGLDICSLPPPQKPPLLDPPTFCPGLDICSASDTAALLNSTSYFLTRAKRSRLYMGGGFVWVERVWGLSGLDQGKAVAPL